MEKVKEWLIDNSDGSGYGYGFVFGNGFGSGDGYGYGFVFGNGFGSGDGDGDGYGFGNGKGDGYGKGDGNGFGSGDGYGLKSFEGKEVHVIDNVQTIIEHIKGDVAKGFILNSDFTLSPCYVVKGHGYFAHGKTLKEAHESLMAKIFENMDAEETIKAFMDKFKKNEKYPGTEFFEWHHYLTGSCLMGRESFVKNKGLDVNAMYTVEEFIEICENAYGGYIIKQLKDVWN